MQQDVTEIQLNQNKSHSTTKSQSDVVGDPSSWLRMLSGLRLIRSMSAPKGVRLVVVVLQQQGPLTDLPPDRQLQAAQVRPLGEVLKAAAKAYYTAAAERLLLKQAEVSAAVGNCPPEISAAINFKLAVLAEFRQDWLAAVSCYQAAAAALHQVPLGRPTVSCQRHAEVMAVAEVVQFKAMMLLLHQQRYAEAVQQLRSHLAALGPLPVGLPMAASAAHYGWLAHQYQCAAQMITGSRMDQATLQFCEYLEAEERKVDHRQQVINLLLEAQATIIKQHSGLMAAAGTAAAPAAGPAGRIAAADRLQARLAWLLAEQYAETSNLTAARKLLLYAVYVYRRYQQQDFGWWRILEVSGGFMPAGPDPTLLTLCLALYSQLPVPLTLTSASRPVLGRVAGPGGGDAFKVWQGVKLGSWASKVHHVGSLPLVKVVAPELMLAGEFAPVQVQVQASTAQPAAALEVSVRSAVVSSTAAVTLLAQSAEGKVLQLTTEGHTLPVPALAAGGSFSQLLWLRSALAGSCRVVAVLACPTLVPASTELSFSQPFMHISRLSSEMNVHTLVAANPAYSAVNTGHPEAAAARGDESTAAVAVGAAAGGSGGGGGGGGQFGVPLAVGQMVFCHVLVQAPNNVDLLLLDADLVLDEKSGVQVINTLGDQLQGKPLPAGQCSVHCLLLQLMPLTPTPAGTYPSSLGHLNLRWRRRQSAMADANSSVGDVKPAVAAVSEEVTTQLELPAVVIQEGLLSVRVVAPHHATAGVAFPYTLQLHNMTAQPQEVLLSVQEAQSVVYSGDKQQTVTCLPRDTHSITWTLVAHAPGQVPLPVIKVASVRFHAQAVTQNCSVQVLPF
eukprot:gene5239-5474_t